MTVIKKLITLSLLLVSTAAWAQKTDGMIITAGDAVQQFAISDVKQLTFTDAGLTVVKTDGATVEFPSSWQIRFGQVDDSGISSVEFSDPDVIVQVFNTDGILLNEVRRADLHIDSLPVGVYILKCGDMTLKILR